METKQSVFIATSLDGFIARSDGDIGWLTSDEYNIGDEDYGYRNFMASVDALVMGRNTFEKALTFENWPYTKTIVVLTHRPLEIPDALSDNVEVMAGDPSKIVEQLADRDLYHLYIDGGKTIQQFLDDGLIQEMIITQIPVIIGEGIPLFGPVEKDIKLEHLSTTSFDDGFVQSRYRIDHRKQN